MIDFELILTKRSQAMNLAERTMQKHSAKPKVRKKIAKRRASFDPQSIIIPTKTGRLSVATIDRIVNSAVDRINARKKK
ncbi:MAG TPA: hypothetical protein VFU82_01415 [Gammaproteobacteria bacterium]|nr:hypothetical protein [Gammaproteobacteria bacterium]